MAQPEAPRPDNLLLTRLNAGDWLLLARHLMPHQLERGTVLQKAGETVVQTWFPCGGASAGFRAWIDAEGSAVDVGTVGREGAVGGIVSNGQISAYAAAEVRDAGLFLSIRTAQLEKAKAESLALRHWFARYADCLVAQLFQNSACNAAHTIRQRAARWLLAAAARGGACDVDLTQEQFAALLGVGRTFVTRVVQDLRQSGLIATRRGTITLRDAEGLQAVSCECSGYIAAHFETAMAGIYPAAQTVEC